MPISSSLGAMCGAMTSTPALGVLIKEIDDESPTIAYASIYPIATILLTISGQILVWISYIPKIFW
jgi:putative transport protein